MKILARIGAAWRNAAVEGYETLESVLAAPGRGWMAPAVVLLATVFSWFVYVPVHELLHAFGCLAGGGSVEELQIAPIYGGRLLARVVPFVIGTGEYAGRLTGFDTGGSDLTYLLTVFAPYILTILGAYPCLRAARRRRSAVAFGPAVVLLVAPLISLTGDYYEIGSILVSAALGGIEAMVGGAEEGSRWLALRHDDLFVLLDQFPARFPRGRIGAAVAVAASVVAGFLVAGATLEAGRLLADHLEPSAGERAAAGATPERAPLPASRQADPRRRRLFNPRRGWFRRLERWINQALSRHVFPYIPGPAVIYGRQLERGLIVSEGSVVLAGLPVEFHHCTILLLTDIHAGAFLTAPRLSRVFERLRPLAPDLILLGGDLTTTRAAELQPHRTALSSLSAPLGVYAVLGNHDHYGGDPAAVRSILEACGITVLHNSHTVLRRGAARVVLCGIDDLHAGQPDLQAALRNIPDGPPIILLSHNPDVVFDAAARGVRLVLSGHTHGGQIRIPGLPVLVRMSRYRLDHGRFHTSGTQLVVSRGLGATGLPVRLFCRPEAVFLRLGCETDRPATPAGGRVVR